MSALAGQDFHQSVHAVPFAHTVSVQADKLFAARCFQPDGFSPWRNLYPGLPQESQQRLQIVGLFFESGVNRHAQPVPVAWRFIPQPLVVTLAAPLWVFHDGVAVFDADGIVQPPHSFGAAPEIAELSGAIQRGGVPNDVVMDMGLVDVGADDKGVFPFGEPHRQLIAQAVMWYKKSRHLQLTEKE